MNLIDRQLQGFRLAFWVGRMYAKVSIFGHMVRREYRFSAFSYAKSSRQIFGIILGLLETTKMYKLF